MKKEYNIGIDIGTSSVGWAVTELDNQKIIRKGNKALWGVRLFEPASTAEDRRKQRSTRRRYDRRRERIKLLQEEFKDEINKIDSKFFQKLEESKYQEGDSFNKKIILQDIEKENIRNYYKKYKTIYHLRCELMNNPEKKDIRLVYLAIHHIIKYRGNFLNNNSNFDTNKLDIQEKLKDLFESIINYLPELDFPEEYEQIIDLNNIEKILLENTIKDTKEKLKNELVDITNSSFATELGKILVGNKCNLKKLLILDDDVNADIDFKSSDYDDKYNEYEEILDDKIEVLDILKQLYDMIFLKKLFKNQSNASISEKMAGEDGYYVNHEKDLKNLKELFKDNRKLYNEIFRNNKKEKDNKKSKCLYEQYIHNAISYNDFKNKIISLKEKLFEDRSLELYDVKVKIYIEKISDRLENGNFLPRITSTDNGRFPYQLNKAELIKIIENQGKYYPFLLNKLEDGTYKLVRLLEFKIPYYVGPLVSNKKSQFAWMIRKQDGAKITPYTFDEVVDKKKTAEIFIKRMISHCTYLNDKVDENGNVVEINYALANNSILYQRFKVMNELKQIKINDKKIENDIQHKIIDDFFKKTSGQLTETKFKNYLHASSDFIMYNGVFNITGYSSENKLANNMQSYIDFFGENGIFENTEYTEDDAEEIIEWITIFEDKDILKEKVKEKYELSDEKINLILNKNYSGWGTLSKRLLTTKYYKDKETEQYKSIMDLMYETKENFMQILNNDEYGFQKMIQDYNNRKDIKALDYSIVENLATSPATKRGIYQSLKVVDEIVKYMSYEPKNIIIEFARSDDKDKKRKDTRKNYLKKLYEACKNQIEDYNKLKRELNTREIDNQRLFLYFIQEGKCLYSGEPINIDDINNTSEYEVDHILPRTLISDDSIDNKALVYRKYNQDKKGDLTLPKNYILKMKPFWKRLKDHKLMSSKKYNNLIREKFTNDDIKGFINRQLVETRQITKHVANILKNYYTESNIIYLKANLSHLYREKYELFKFREINDYHHAHDAYLAAVIGEYKENYINKEVIDDMVNNFKYNIDKIDDKTREKLKFGFVINSLDENLSLINEKTGEVFNSYEFNKRVEDTLYRNDILVSRKTEIRTGKFYKETIYKKGVGTIPIKDNMRIDLYGGYSNINTSNLCLIEYNKKKKLVGIPINVTIKNDKNLLYNFLKEQINAKNIEDIKILKEKIPFESELFYEKQKVYIKGYGVRHKNCELSNATQLHISKDNMQKWKYAFMYILKNDNKYIENAIKDIDNIYDFLVEIENYSLFYKEILKIKEKLNFYSLDIESKKNIIRQILIIYHCDSDNGNLKEYGLGDRIGRITGKNVTTGILISKSATGIKEHKYEF